jgi:hypothetical protein
VIAERLRVGFESSSAMGTCLLQSSHSILPAGVERASTEAANTTAARAVYESCITGTGLKENRNLCE